jgi:hypothetical protein
MESSNGPALFVFDRSCRVVAEDEERFETAITEKRQSRPVNCEVVFWKSRGQNTASNSGRTEKELSREVASIDDYMFGCRITALLHAGSLEDSRKP